MSPPSKPTGAARETPVKRTEDGCESHCGFIVCHTGWFEGEGYGLMDEIDEGCVWHINTTCLEYSDSLRPADGYLTTRVWDSQ